MCRKPEVVAFTDGGWPKGLVWTPDTPAHRRELELLVKVGNRLYGEGSHWFEEREE